MRAFYPYLFLFLIFTNCSKKVASEQSAAITPSDSTDENEFEFDEGETQCVFQKGNAMRENSFPFNVSDKIELVSYQSRTDAYSNDSLVRDGKFVVLNIEERVALNKLQVDSLFSILYNYKVKRMGDGMSFADCYDPHHSIVFYNSGKAIAFFEICFSCHGAQQTKGIESVKFCDEKWCMLQKHFNSCGIKSGFQYSHCP